MSRFVGNSIALVARFARTLRSHPIASGSLALLAIAVLGTPGADWRQQSRHGSNPTTQTSAATSPHFRDITLQAGVVFSHLQGDEHLTGIDETLGAGACAFDYDGDGWVDLYLVNGSGQTRYYGAQHWWHLPKGNTLYRNVGGRFEDVTDDVGLRGQTWGMGCAAGDFDNDGDSDLLTTNLGSLRLHRNDNGRFVDVTADSHLSAQQWATSAALGDYDGDGLLDIYIANYVDFAKAAHTYEGNSQYAREFSRAFSPLLYAGVADRLYRNVGGLRFDDVTAQAGVMDASGRTLAAAWLDIDADHRPELLVANDSGTTNFLYSNRGRGKFEETGLRYLFNDARGSHAFSIGDVDNDGMMDVAVSSVAGEPPMLLLNERAPDGTSRVFRNRSRQLGLAARDDSVLGGWGIELADFNNDGRLDLLQASGLLMPDAATAKVPQGQPKRLWIQTRDGHFSDVTDAAGTALLDTQSARGIAVADFDNDGLLDVYVAHNNDLGQLLHNETAQAHWLGLKLQARAGNRDAIGTRVELRSGATRQYRVVTSGGFLSGSDRRVHFGLGENTRDVDLVIVWPDGSEQTFRDLPIDRYLTLTQDSVTAVRQRIEAPPATAGRDRLRVGAERPEYRLQYLRWVTAHSEAGADRGQTIEDLSRALRDDDVRVRLLAAQWLGQHQSADGLALLIGALEDSEPRIRIAAIDAVRQHEDEASMRWLLRVFRDPDPTVRTALAETFAFFYRKEEAVVYRKYLALPHLMRLTLDEDSNVRRAAARAIGEAKRYEGIDPLLALLDDSVEAVRAEAACSLGLIRDRKAVDTLQRLANEPSTPPLVRAHALIALQRLDELSDQALKHTVDRGLRAPDAQFVQRTLQTLNEIFGNSMHGVVLDRALLTDTLIAALNARAGLDRSTRLAAIETLRLAAGTRSERKLVELTNDPDATVREAAYLALLKVDRATRAAHYTRALADPNTGVRLRILQELRQDQVQLPSAALLANLRESGLRGPTIAALRGTHDPTVLRELAVIAKDAREAIPVRVDAMQVLADAGSIAPPVPAALLTDDAPEIQATATRWWGARLPFYLPQPDIPDPLRRALRNADRNVSNSALEVLQARHEAWAARYLQAAVLEVKTDVGVRRRILDGFAAAAVPRAHEVLLAVAGRRDDPLRYSAVASLPATDAQARELLWNILKNPAEDSDLRFAAAARLQAIESSAVLTMLRKG